MKEVRFDYASVNFAMNGTDEEFIKNEPLLIYEPVPWFKPNSFFIFYSKQLYL